MTVNNMENSRLISVILPVYNGEAFIGDAIKSILSQTYHSFELIVVDDGSTDRTKEIVLSYPEIKYVYQSNQGVAAARNVGIKIAKGDFLAFLDADDLWLPNKLSLQVDAFERDPSLDVVTGFVEQFLSSEMELSSSRKFLFHNKPITGYVPGAVMIKRKVFEITGLFHEDKFSSETVSWFEAALEKDLHLLILPEVVTRRRIHGNNISILDREIRKSELLKILKSRLDRKRARS